jgi:hypothetical protein
MAELEHWDSFYVIVGAAAGALIGLQFVVMTLIAENPPKRVAEANPVFATPTIVHFSLCLLVSALMSVPWESAVEAAWAWGLTGLGGFIYTLMVAARMRQQQAYTPDAEDWLFHALLPLCAYLFLGLSASSAQSHEHSALFGVGAATVGLLFIGIHNSWDSVVFISTGQAEKKDTPDQ